MRRPARTTCSQAGPGGGPGALAGPRRITAYAQEPWQSQFPGARPPEVFNVLLGKAREVRSTPFGDVGTVFSGQGIEVVWVSKMAEPVDQNWFSLDQVGLILVVQDQLKFEFESPGQPARVLSPGEALVLPARQRCRAY